MKNSQIENRLAEEVRAATPDIYEKVSAAVVSTKKEKNMNTNTPTKRSPLMKITAIAASLALVIGLAFFALSSFAVAGTITLDVNPSVEIEINSREKVISVTALNTDAAAIIGDMNLKNTDLEVAVNAIIGSMVQNGYIDESNNAILVTVSCSSTKLQEALKIKVENDINLSLTGDKINPVVINQTATVGNSATSQAKEMANDSGISVGKALLIQKALARYPELAAYDLNNMTINEIVRLCSTLYIDIDDVIDDDDFRYTSTVSTAGNSGHISGAQAKQAALDHAGLTIGEVTMKSVVFDSDDRPAHFEVEFLTADAEFDYEIDAVTGAVISFEIDNDDDSIFDGIADDIHDIIDKAQSTASEIASQVQSAVNSTVQEVQSTANSVADSFNGNGNGGNFIGAQKAKEIALQHAGFSAGEAKYVRIDFDRAEGYEPANYDVEFTVGGREYEYEIDALTGQIISHESEYDD